MDESEHVLARIYFIDDFKTRDEGSARLGQCYCRATSARYLFVSEELKCIRAMFTDPQIFRFDAVWEDLPRQTRELADCCDFIYSSDLLARLPDVAAKQAIKAAYSYLRPGGHLLFANPALADQVSACPECLDAGRAYRTEIELANLTKDLPSDLFAGQAVFRDTSGLNVYLEVYKSAQATTTNLKNYKCKTGSLEGVCSPAI